jgi:hypothetical protein
LFKKTASFNLLSLTNISIENLTHATSNNIITKGMSGMIDDIIIFRQRIRKTMVTAAPQPTTREATGKELEQREKFQHTIIYDKKPD